MIYDLGNHVLVEHGLDNVPYDGIVEGYFGADKLSDSLKEKFGQYKDLVKKECLCEEELDEIAELEVYLDEIPDYLVSNIFSQIQSIF